MLVDPAGHWVWAVVNAGFAIYDGYKAYKSGADWKSIAWAAGSNFLKIGYVKKAGKALKAVSKGKVPVRGRKFEERVLKERGLKKIQK